MRNILAPRFPNLPRGERLDSQRSTVQRHEFNLVGFAATMNMHDHTHVTGLKTSAGNIFRQYNRCRNWIGPGMRLDGIGEFLPSLDAKAKPREKYGFQ